MRVNALQIACGLVLMAASGLGLAALAGKGGVLLRSPLHAEVRVTPFPIPADFGVSPEIVSEYLVRELGDRAKADVALRFTLGSDGQEKMQKVVLPRLLNAGVVRRMIDDIRPLQQVLAMGSFRQVAEIAVVNDGPPLADVAILMPGLVLAEADGAPLAVTDTRSGVTALALGDMGQGTRIAITAWLDERASVPPGILKAQIKLGADGGARGRVQLSGATGWAGAQLEVLPLARWLIGAVLGLGFLAGAAAVALPLVAALARRPRRRRMLDMGRSR